MNVEQMNRLKSLCLTPTTLPLTPWSRYLSDPFLPLFSEFRRAGIHLAGIECPLWAFPGRKRQHGQRGCHKSKCASLENGEPIGENVVTPRSSHTGLLLTPRNVLSPSPNSMEATHGLCSSPLLGALLSSSHPMDPVTLWTGRRGEQGEG